MKSCKQVSWGYEPNEAEESMTTSSCIQEKRSSIRCSLVVNNLRVSNWNRNSGEEEEEMEVGVGECRVCSMCGDVGLPQYLFKCLRCSHRYQHIYCGKFYPYRIQATICNWCLPMDQLVKTTPDVDDHTYVKVCNSIHPTNRDMKSDLETNPNFPIDQQKQGLKKHTKAFEYLLLIAELHALGHQWDNLAQPFEEENRIIGTKLAQENLVGHYQSDVICKFYEAKELKNQEPASLLMQEIIIRDYNDDQTKSFYGRRRGDKIDSVRRPSINSAHDLQCSHSHGYTGYGQMGRNQDEGQYSQIIRKSLNCDQITENLYNKDSGHNQSTMKKLNYEQIDQRNDLQEPANIHLVKDHEIGCTDRDYQNAKRSHAAAFKHAQLHKQSEVAAGSNHCHINTTDQLKMHNQTACSACSDDSDDRRAGKFCGLSWHGAGDHSKRPRHGELGVEQVIASENDEFNPATRQRGTIVSSETGNTATDHNRQSVASSKQGSPNSQHEAARSRPAGKRDHLMNSPLRAMKCRYKLLADVLC